MHSIRECDKQEWKRLKNLYKGQTGFVIGNGPSLKISDLDRLTGKVTIGSNRLYLAYDLTAFRPTILTCIDQIVAENSIEEFQGLPGKKYFASTLHDIMEPMPESIYWQAESGYIEGTLKRRFSPDAKNCLYAGHSITYNNLQIAYHLGLKTVYLIGMDFHFNLPESRVSHEYTKATQCEGEVNHFLPNYRKKGELYSLPDFKRQIGALEGAKYFFEKNGRKIYNATRGGKLEVFERVNFDNIVD